MSSSHVPISLRDPFWDDPAFSSSRSEFDTIRRDVMRREKDFWSNLDEDDFLSSNRGGGGVGSGLASTSAGPEVSTNIRRTTTTTTSSGSGPGDMVTRRTTESSTGSGPDDMVTRRSTTTSGPGSGDLLSRRTTSSTAGTGIDDLLNRRTGSSADDLLGRRTLSRQYSNPSSAYPRWLFPENSSRNYGSTDLMAKADLDLFGNDSQVRIKEDDAKFEITLDVQNYKPDELKVRTQPDNTVIIEGKHEERSTDKPPGRYSSSATGLTSSALSQQTSGHQSAVTQQFSRRFTLPHNCDPLRVISNLSRYGVMVVTAPKKRESGIGSSSIGARDRNIPVVH